LQDKAEVASIFKKFAKKAQNQSDVKIKKIRSDNGKELDNTNIEEYYDEVGIKHEFSSTYTPQQNEVVGRKNWTLITLAKTMLDEYNTSEKMWAEAINTGCYASNQLFPHKFLEKTLLGILNIITKSRLSFLILITVPKMSNLSLIPLKPSCYPQHDMRDAVLKYAIAHLNK